MGCPSQRAPLGSNGIQVQVRLEGRRGGGGSSGGSGGRGEEMDTGKVLQSRSCLRTFKGRC